MHSDLKTVKIQIKLLFLLVRSHMFSRKWIENQIYGGKLMENYCSIWHIVYGLPTASLNLLDHNAIGKCFNWINIGPKYCSENKSQRSKTTHRLYLLQEIEAK